MYLLKDRSSKGKLYNINYLSIPFQSGKGKLVQKGTYPLFSNQENQFKSHDWDIWTNRSTHNEILKLAYSVRNPLVTQVLSWNTLFYLNLLNIVFSPKT